METASIETTKYEEKVLEPIGKNYKSERVSNLRYIKPVTSEGLEEFKPDLSVLTQEEREMFYIMNSHRKGGGLLFLTSSPGFGKSAIYKSIAEKLKMNYICVPLAGADETNLGNYPRPKMVKTFDGDGNPIEIEVVGFIPPEWAAIANSRPTLVHFEEINRCPKNVRNAILSIINERVISYLLKFNSNVFMCSCGNLDDEDTEEMGKALRGRIVEYKHELTIPQWEDNFAYDNVHELITEYINNDPDKFNPDIKSNYDAISYPSARSWTFFSNWLTMNLTNGCITNHKEGAITQDMVEIICRNVKRYVGAEFGTSFETWIKDNIGFSIYDIIEDYPSVREKVKTTFARGKAHSFMERLKRDKNFSVINLTKEQWLNLVSFLTEKIDDGTGKEQPLIYKDQAVGYIKYFVFDINNPNVKDIVWGNQHLITPWILESVKYNFAEAMAALPQLKK